MQLNIYSERSLLTLFWNEVSISERCKWQEKNSQKQKICCLQQLKQEIPKHTILRLCVINEEMPVFFSYKIKILQCSVCFNIRAIIITLLTTRKLMMCHLNISLFKFTVNNCINLHLYLPHLYLGYSHYTFKCGFRFGSWSVETLQFFSLG